MTIVKVLTEARKFGVAVLGVIAQVIELGVLHGTALHWAQTVSGVVAAVLTYVVPNAPAKPAVPPTPPASA